MDEAEVLRILAHTGAVLTNGHFVYTSGKHGEAYVNKDALIPHTEQLSLLCEAIARRFESVGVEVVASPATAGVALSQWVAHHLSLATGHQVLAVYADKGAPPFEKIFDLRRGYDKLVEGQRVLVVEDVLTTGGSAASTIQAVRRYKGQVAGVAALCNRGNVLASDLGEDIPNLFSLVNVSLDAWNEAECPLCVQSIPINTSVGHGKQYLERKRQS